MDELGLCIVWLWLWFTLILCSFLFLHWNLILCKLAGAFALLTTVTALQKLSSDWEELWDVCESWISHYFLFIQSGFTGPGFTIHSLLHWDHHEGHFQLKGPLDDSSGSETSTYWYKAGITQNTTDAKSHRTLMNCGFCRAIVVTIAGTTFRFLPLSHDLKCNSYLRWDLDLRFSEY